MKVFAWNKRDQNLSIFDPWTVIHTSTGLFAGLVGISPWISLAAAVGYEALEQYAEDRPWGQQIFRTSGRETKANVISDIVVFMLGWWLGNAYHRSDLPRAIAGQ